MKSLFGKQKFLLIIFLANSFLLFGQTKIDTLSVVNYIVKRGYFTSYNEFKREIADPVSYITVFTSEDSAFSVSDGIIKSFFKVHGDDFVIIESKDAWFTYGKVDILGLKKLDTVRVGQFLGIISKTNYDEKNIVFALCYKNKNLKCLDYIELYDYLKKYEK